MTQKQITLALDPTTETTGNAEQVARMIGCSAWHISGDFLVIENPLLGYKVTDNETYSSPNETTIPDGATIILLEEEQNKLRAGIDKLLETRIPILDQIYELCLAIEKCGASPELTDAVTKAGALRKPISELVEQAVALGIGEGIVSVSYSKPSCDIQSCSGESSDEAMEEKLKVQSTAPRVTLDRINELKSRVKYVTVQQPGETTSTFVHAYLDGKFLLASGFSACVSADNFNADIGKEIAQKKAEQEAVNKLWELEGYALYAKTNGIDLEQPAIDVNDYILSKKIHQNDTSNIFECALTIKDNIEESTIVVGTGETASDAVQSAYKIAAALLSAWVY